MSDLVEIHSNLQQASSILNQAATDIVHSNLNYPTAAIKNIGEALASITEVQLAIYDIDSTLRPVHMIDASDAGSVNRVFGNMLLEIHSLLARNDSVGAQKLLTDFVLTRPGEHYVQMAQNEAARITDLFGK